MKFEQWKEQLSERDRFAAEQIVAWADGAVWGGVNDGFVSVTDRSILVKFKASEVSFDQTWPLVGIFSLPFREIGSFDACEWDISDHDKPAFEIVTRESPVYGECPECDGDGEIACSECGHENDCDECGGDGFSNEIVGYKSEDVAGKKSVVTWQDANWTWKYLNFVFALARRFNGGQFQYSAAESGFYKTGRFVVGDLTIYLQSCVRGGEWAEVLQTKNDRETGA